MEELPLTLHSARVLILGFGRVGKLTAHRMGALGAKVTVCAQGYADLAWAAAYGHETMWLEKLGGELGGYDLIVNTIPAQVLDRRRQPSGTLYTTYFGNWRHEIWSNRGWGLPSPDPSAP